MYSAAACGYTRRMAIKEVCSGLQFPEGPVVMDDGSVIVVEVKGGTIARVTPDGKVERIAKPGGGPNGAAIGPDGALYLCNNGGLVWERRRDMDFPGHTAHGNPNYSGGRIERIDLKTGKVDVLYDKYEDGRPLLNPNDIMFDTAGGFWFTDHGRSFDTHREWGALLYATPDGKHISTQATHILSPNGVGVSPDGKWVYYAESLTGRVFGCAIEKPGVVAKLGNRPGGKFIGAMNGLAFFDSLGIQANGGVCVATIGQHAGITTIMPDGSFSNTSLAELKDPMITNIAFGGKDMKTAFITASASGKLISMAWPEAGYRLPFNA